MKKSEFIKLIKTELSINLEKFLALGLDEDDDSTIKTIKLILSDEKVLKLSTKDAESRKQLIVMLETVKAFLQLFETNLDAQEEDVLNAQKQGEINGNIRAIEIEKDFYDDID